MNALDMAPTQRTDLSGFVGDIERLEAIFETWDETPRGRGRSLSTLDRGPERRGACAGWSGRSRPIPPRSPR